MESKNISWDVIEARLKEIGKGPKWLADELGIGKQAVANWKPRGGAPASYAKDLATHLGISISELLGSDDLIDAPKRRDNQPLSNEARELISCVTRLDALGEIPRKMFEYHKGLLLLSVVSTELEDLLTGRKRLAKIDQALATRLETSGEPFHAGKKHR